MKLGFLKFLVIPTVLIASFALAQDKPKPPKNAFQVLGVFNDLPGRYSAKDFFTGEVVEVKDEVPPSPEEEPKEEKPARSAEDQKLLDRVNPESPNAFQDLVINFRKGDIGSANYHADRYVDYMLNLMGEVREITKIIGASLVRKGQIDEEDWIGVEQYLDWEFANAREDMDSPIRASHNQAMTQIEPDPKHEVEIYYFFTLNSKWSRLMAPDIERLWTISRGDKRIKMVALTLGPVPNKWVESYREYTGLTIPILSGDKIAKSFDVAFAPAIVIVTPNNNKAYKKTGQQNFGRLYEFLRTAQGLPTNINPHIRKLMETPIGEAERLQRASGKPLYIQQAGESKGKIIRTRVLEEDRKVKIRRF